MYNTENTKGVKVMLFRRKIPHSCAYCIHATRLNDDEALCVKRGIVRIDKACMRFRYDPCKRQPLKIKATDFRKYEEDDFTL